jgi:hypothetical protein
MIFRLVRPTLPESDLHTAVAQALDVLLLPPAIWTTFPSGHVELTGPATAKPARLGRKRNWPDVLVLHDGVLHGIELKRPGQTLSRSRVVRTRCGRLRLAEGRCDAFPRLERACMRLAVCTSVDGVLTQLAVWGMPLRRRA